MKQKFILALILTIPELITKEGRQNTSTTLSFSFNSLISLLSFVLGLYSCESTAGVAAAEERTARLLSPGAGPAWQVDHGERAGGFAPRHAQWSLPETCMMDREGQQRGHYVCP